MSTEGSLIHSYQSSSSGTLWMGLFVNVTIFGVMYLVLFAWYTEEHDPFLLIIAGGFGLVFLMTVVPILWLLATFQSHFYKIFSSGALILGVKGLLRKKKEEFNINDIQYVRIRSESYYSQFAEGLVARTLYDIISKRGDEIPLDKQFIEDIGIFTKHITRIKSDIEVIIDVSDGQEFGAEMNALKKNGILYKRINNNGRDQPIRDARVPG
jgi:hypothetical protein